MENKFRDGEADPIIPSLMCHLDPFGLLQSQRFAFLLRALLSSPFPYQEYHRVFFFGNTCIAQILNPLRFRFLPLQPKMTASRHGSIDAGVAFRGARWALHVGMSEMFFWWLKKSLKNTRKQLQELNNFRGAYILLPVVPVPPAWSMVRDPEPNNRNRHQKQKLREKSLQLFFFESFACLFTLPVSAFENVNSESFTLTLTGLDY